MTALIIASGPGTPLSRVVTYGTPVFPTHSEMSGASSSTTGSDIAPLRPRRKKIKAAEETRQKSPF